MLHHLPPSRPRAAGIPMPEAGVVLGAGLGPGGPLAGGAPVPKLQMPTALTRHRRAPPRGVRAVRCVNEPLNGAPSNGALSNGALLNGAPVLNAP